MNKNIISVICSLMFVTITGCTGSDSDKKESIKIFPNIKATAVYADTDSIRITWTDPDDADLDHINIVCTSGTNVDVSPATLTYEFTSLSLDTVYEITFVSVYSSGKTSGGNVFLVSTTGSGEVNHTAITNATEFDKIRNHLDGNFFLASDIDLSEFQSGDGWDPIGVLAGMTVETFQGTLNGNDCTITGLYINTSTNGYYGIFNNIGSANICNIDIKNADITSANTAGCLTGTDLGNSTIKYCTVSGTINAATSGNGVGGLAGGIAGGTTVSHCHSSVSIDAYTAAGGLAGYNIGGIISDCSATGNVISRTGMAGGLIGENSNGTVTRSYATGNVSGSGEYCGGITGTNNDGTFGLCYATGSVTGTEKIGGFSGWSNGTLQNCYARGNVTGDDYVGGLTGGTDNGTITCSYSTGLVSSSGTNAGGLNGYNNICTFNNCYWNTETSGRSTSSGGTGYTSAEMRVETNFTDWDFDRNWIITASVNSGFPYLR